MSDDRRVRFAKMKLAEQERIWWRGVQERMARMRQRCNLNLEEIKMKIKRQFLRPDYKENLYDWLVKLEQGIFTVHEYTENFNELIVL